MNSESLRKVKVVIGTRGVFINVHEVARRIIPGICVVFVPTANRVDDVLFAVVLASS